MPSVLMLPNNEAEGCRCGEKVMTRVLMSQKIRITAWLLCTAVLSACNGQEPELTQSTTVPKVETPSPAFKPPTFADMVKINKPLATVRGDYKPLSFPKIKNSEMGLALDGFTSQSESYAVLVWHNGQIVYENYPEPYSGETRGESASMHKSVMALLVGIAIEDGYLSGVDASVASYVPEWVNDAKGKITIRDLLEMSTGLKPLSSEGGMNSPAVKFMSQGENARQTILKMELTGTPGDTFHYQNAASQILCLILENATGKDYQDYLSEKLWGPINAKDAKVWLNEKDGFARTYSSLYAVPRDWLRVGLLIKDDGAFEGKQIVPASYIKAMTSPSRTYDNYGWQIWRGKRHEPVRYYNEIKQGYAVKANEPFAVDDMLYFDGFGGQRVYISRSKDLVIVRLGNVRMDWDDSQLPNLVLSRL